MFLDGIQNAIEERRVFLVRAAPQTTTRQWQLIDTYDNNAIWEIEQVEDSFIPGDVDVHCIRHADRYAKPDDIPPIGDSM